MTGDVKNGKASADWLLRGGGGSIGLFIAYQLLQLNGKLDVFAAKLEIVIRLAMP